MVEEVLVVSKKIEVIVLENDEFVVHRSVSTVNDDSNVFNVVIQAMVNQLTSTAGLTSVKHIKAAEPKVAPRNIHEEDMTEDRRKRIEAENKEILARQKRDQEVSIKELEPIKMSNVLGSK